MQNMQLIFGEEGKRGKPVEITHRNRKPQKRESCFCNMVEMASRLPPMSETHSPIYKLDYIDDIKKLRMEM